MAYIVFTAPTFFRLQLNLQERLFSTSSMRRLLFHIFFSENSYLDHFFSFFSLTDEMLKADNTIYKLLPEMAIIKCGQFHKARSPSRPVKGAAVNALESELRKIH